MSANQKAVIPVQQQIDLPRGSMCIWLQHGKMSGPAHPAIVMRRIKPGVFELRALDRAVDQPRNVGHHTGFTTLSGNRFGAWATIEEYHAYEVEQEAARKERTHRGAEAQRKSFEQQRLQTEAEIIEMFRNGTSVEDCAKFFCTPIADVVELIKRDEQAKQRMSNRKAEPSAAK